MKRLYKIPAVQYCDWRQARQDHGRAKYGDAHLHRYGVVDVMEELLDAQNIVELLRDRVKRSELSQAGKDDVLEAVTDFRIVLQKLEWVLLRIDRSLPDELCTDEQGGHRIWWGDDQ